VLWLDIANALATPRGPGLPNLSRGRRDRRDAGGTSPVHNESLPQAGRFQAQKSELSNEDAHQLRSEGYVEGPPHFFRDSRKLLSPTLRLSDGSAEAELGANYGASAEPGRAGRPSERFSIRYLVAGSGARFLWPHVVG